MAATLSKASPSSAINSRVDRLTHATNGIDRAMLRASIDVNRACLSESDAIALVFETFDAVGLTDKEAARLMKVDAGQLGRIKAGKGRLPFDALWLLPDTFWVEFDRRIREAKGLTAESEERLFAQHVGNLVTAILTHRIARRRSEISS